MKLELEGSLLAHALKAGVAQRSGTLPILQHALLEADNGMLRITTTDLEAQAVFTMPAKVMEAGRTTAQVSLLQAASRDGNVKLTANGAAYLQVAPAGGGKFRVPVMEANDFPIADRVEWIPLRIDAAEAARAFAGVACAAGTKDVRFYLNTIAICRGFIGASDGHRGALWPVDYDGHTVMVPIRQSEAVAALLVAEAKLEIAVADARATMLRVVNGAAELSVRLIDGNFPDLLRLLPEQDATAEEPWALLDRAKLLGAVRNFLPFCEEKYGHAAFLSIGDGDAQLLDRSRENSENAAWALGLGKQGSPFEIFMRMDWLAQTLAAIDAEKLRVIKKPDNGGALVVVAQGDDVPPVRHIIQSVRI